MRSTVTVVGIVGTLLLAGAAAALAETVARVGKRTISSEDLEKRLRPQLFEVENTRYQVLRQGLDAMIAESLIEQEAAARGVSVEALKKEEIEAKTGKPTDQEIQALYDANKEELEAPLDEVKDQIVEYLSERRKAEARQAFVDRLKSKYPTSTSLRPPVIEVGTGSRPSRGGGPNAPVTIVEFSDYECPFCKKAEPTVDKVVAAYGDKVRVFYRDYPLPFHANARPAAEAAHCANAQGKFWEYHAKLMASEALQSETFAALADQLGLDRAKFDECVAKKEFDAALEKDISDASEVGVNGTPVFFVNGRMLGGAQPFEQFQAVIDEEIARNTKGK